MEKKYTKSTLRSWNIDPKVFPYDSGAIDKLLYLVRFGCLAPSVHNQQPWEIKKHAQHITITPSHQRQLRHGDPTGRESWISIGAFCENIIHAANAFGYKVHISFIDSHPKIELRIEEEHKLNPSTLVPILERRTDRTLYTGVPLKNSVIRNIKSNFINGTSLEVVTSKKRITDIANLNSRALKLALSIPVIKKELANAIQYSSNKSTGIPTYALSDSLAERLFLSLRTKYFSVANREASLDHKRISSSSALCLFFSDGDVARDWFASGRLYEKVFLHATKLHISGSTFAALVEAPDFHKDVEKMLNTNKRLQAVLRLGIPSNKKLLLPTPRIELENITSN